MAIVDHLNNVPMLRYIIAIASTALLGGCSDSSPSAPIPCSSSTGSVQATVQQTANGTRFDWQPACAVALLLVEENASDRWVISAPNMDENSTDASNIIVPPVVYGQAPAGATEDAPAQALVPGRTYELILWKAVSPGTSVTCQSRFGNACMLTVKAFVR